MKTPPSDRDPKRTGKRWRPNVEARGGLHTRGREGKRSTSIKRWFGESQRHGNKYVREFSKCEKSISITTVSVNQRYSSCSSSRPQSL
ncbi:uncharacterized protein LOC113205953 isoform X2 [Frankliniella occidentalis]|uniref:Uncharacterized protein LOC113205953 isoform X2 n=1 Tax=Frankliniella occidentalis TaxID=133901 RepID=A0A9C6U0X0_FRAOC|nr:uncharacterized protein LOC113205953 isoform X2 [Frankliniella occidentalis]